MISGVILARNEALNIVDCLRSLQPHVAEILLVDMESTDATVELARPFVSQVLRHPLIPNFDAARNAAIPAARHEWLWFLDADERVRPVTGHLVNEIVRRQGHEITAISIPFQTHFAGQWIQHCGWWPGYTMPRVLKRGYFEFGEELHSGVRFDGVGVRVEADPELAIAHFSYRDIAHYVEKFNRYTSTEALNLARRGAGLDWREAVRAMCRDLWLYYERNEGRRDGLRGWILSWLAGQYRWFSHAKLSDLPELQGAVSQANVPCDLREVLAVMDEELSQLRGEPPATGCAVVWRSPLFDPSGYAEDGRTVLKALAGGERPVRAEEIPWSDQGCELPPADVTLFRALLRGRRTSPALTITNCIPTLCAPDPTAEINVLRTTFETDRIPTEWLPRLARFDEIWVLSQHNARAFRRSGVPPEKLHVVPAFVDTTLFTPDGPRSELPAPCDGRFVFLSVFDWQARKGWDALARAYVQEFAVEDGCALLLKVTAAHGPSRERMLAQLEEVLAAEGQSLAARPDVVLWSELLSAAQLAGVYRRVDAFVLASRGEGWGRPYLEALASGLTTIGTRGSGNDDFMHAGNSLLVATTPTEVSPAAAAEISVYRGHRWHDPDLTDLRRRLRQALVDRDVLRELRTEGVSDARRLFSLDAAQTLLAKTLDECERRHRDEPAPTVGPGAIRVELEGEFFAGHSFANINEQLALRLRDADGLALTLRRRTLNPTQDRTAPLTRRLRSLFHRDLGGPPQIVIRHAFPPNWDPPPAGRWVHIQPWEFGALPRAWLAPLRERVDEVWAPSNFVRDVYVRSGVAPEKIHVIPWGVDPEVYRPDVPPLHLPHDECFRFLYVGGTVPRKGFDLLLRAYCEEFSATEPVALIVKDVGTRTFYRYGNAREEVLRRIASGDGPRMAYVEEEMTDGTRASLYAACDCLAAPYRGEGFGLPVLEAMACGLPPLVPRGGPTDDFVTDDTGFLLPASVVECAHDWRLCGPATELAIDLGDLRRALRRAYEDRADTRRRGAAAAQFARAERTWDQTVARMVERVRALAAPSNSAVSPLVPTVAPDDGNGGGADPSTFQGANETTLVGPRTLDLTLCVLARNSADTLGELLAEARPWVREIVLHDLGSTDESAALAREYGARITLGADVDDLAAAWNTTLGRATAEWILCLRGDERLDEEDFEGLARELSQVPEDVLGLRVEVLAADASVAERNGWHGEVRIIRNLDGLVFEHAGAERVTSSIRRLGGRVANAPVVVRGASAAADEHRRRRVLHEALQDQRGDVDAIWGLALAHARSGDFFHAECFFHDCLERLPPDDPRQRDTLEALVECYRRIGDDLRASEFHQRLRTWSGGAT